MKTVTLQTIAFLAGSCLLVLCAACQTPPSSLLAHPTSLPPGSRSAAMLPPPAPTPVPLSMEAPAESTSRAPRGAIVIAGVGALSAEITALPQFVSDALYDSLLRVNPQNGALEPGLATTWSVSEDAKTITFTLRHGLLWHDGTPLTAGDVVWTFKTLSDPKMRITPAGDFGPLGDVTAPDASTVKLTFHEAYCAALTSLGGVKILPRHKLEGKPLDQVAPNDLVGTGPLILQKWNGTALEFQANPAYWRGAPGIATWTYRIYPDEHAAQAAVAAGQADVFAGSTAVAQVKHTSVPANEFYALVFNTGREPLGEVTVRRALAMAVDPQAILKELDQDTVSLQSTWLASFWAAPRGIKQAPFDPVGARQLLATAGWQVGKDGILVKSGQPFALTLWAQADDPRSEVVAQLVRQQLQGVGVQAILKLDERSLYLTRLFMQEYDLAVAHFNIPLDPDQHYFWSSTEKKPGFGLNVTAYANPAVDAALTAGNRAAHCDSQARAAAVGDLARQLASDLPALLLFAPPRVLNTSARVGGTAPSSFAGPFWNLEVWEVAP